MMTMLAVLQASASGHCCLVVKVKKYRSTIISTIIRLICSCWCLTLYIIGIKNLENLGRIKHKIDIIYMVYVEWLNSQNQFDLSYCVFGYYFVAKFSGIGKVNISQGFLKSVQCAKMGPALASHSITTSNLWQALRLTTEKCPWFCPTAREFTSYWIWVRSWRCNCLITWLCCQLIAKPSNKTVASLWPDPYTYITHYVFYFIFQI